MKDQKPLAKIIAVATALPEHRLSQEQIFAYMERAYQFAGTPEARKLRFVYSQSGIDSRHSVLADFYEKHPAAGSLFTEKDVRPSLERRMEIYNEEAPKLTVLAAEKVLRKSGVPAEEITHFITVSCTGLSAPGLDLMSMELLGLPADTQRTAVNFMGCYAAIHGLKLAQGFVAANADAKVLLVCTELCTLHFQNQYDEEGAVSAALFADGASAAIITCGDAPEKGFGLENFYSEVQWKGKAEMAWNLSSTGFLMRLSGYVPDLLATDIAPLFDRALSKAGLAKTDIGHWCIHPGGKRILMAIEKGLGLSATDLHYSYDVLRAVGNLSSATILFVLEAMWEEAMADDTKATFGVAFGPGLTMESFILKPA